MADDLATFREPRRAAPPGPFDRAWAAEVDGRPAPAFRDAWQRAYERRPPTSIDRAAARLAIALEA
ncbi:MAG: hypothetical protein ACRDPC_12880, partial [Solirubrobacteraceae bacterium]